MIIFIIKCVSIAVTSSFSFDGAVNVQISQNLAKTFQYKTNYATNFGINYSGRLFDQTITLGLPVTLPVAIIFRYFSESFTAGLIINAIYLIFLALAIIYYLKICLKLNNYLVLLAIILLYGTPNLFGYGFGLYGEIPMLFYLILVLIFLHKHEDSSKTKFLFLAGVFLGVGYLTKTIILICVPALILAITFDFFIKRHLTIRKLKDVKLFFQDYAMLPVGFSIPVFVFELYKLISIGATNYLSWWKDQLMNILYYGGVKQGSSVTNGVLVKFLSHLDVLCTFKGINKPIIIGLLTILLLLFFVILFYGIYIYYTNQRPGKSEKLLFSNDNLVLITVTLSYFGWWLFITDFTWERYIFNGYILLEICLVVFVSFAVIYGQKLVPKKRKVSYMLLTLSMVIYISLLLVGSIINIYHSKDYLISFEDTAEKKAVLKAGDYIRNLPESAEIFGYGWWQAPVVAFASGRTFENIYDHPELLDARSLTDKYLVVDLYAYYLDPPKGHNILDQYDYQLVFSQENEKIFIYILNNKFDNPPVK